MSLPINLFDLVALAIVVGGLLHGRKRGLSVEFPSLVKWIALLVVCAVAYRPLGQLISKAGFFDLLSAYLLAYLGTALVVFLAFQLLERRLGPKLEGSDVFGRAEYYLGMGSGLVRFCCMLLAALALLNAREFTPYEVKSMERFQEDVYGSDLFPTLYTIQTAVFKRSLAGSFIKEDLGFLLITPTETNQREPRLDSSPNPPLQSANTK